MYMYMCIILLYASAESLYVTCMQVNVFVVFTLLCDTIVGVGVADVHA